MDKYADQTCQELIDISCRIISDISRTDVISRTLLDHQILEKLLGVTGRFEMQSTRRGWVEDAIRRNALKRDCCWSESLAVGGEEFFAGVKDGLGIKGWSRMVTKEGPGFVLRENGSDYVILPLKSPL
jgi:hypothetical protein